MYINVSQHITLSIQGGDELHLSGYFEPSRDDDGMGDDLLYEDGEEEELEEDDEKVEGANKLNKNLKQA